jgi:hypothetical protein
MWGTGKRTISVYLLGRWNLPPCSCIAAYCRQRMFEFVFADSLGKESHTTSTHEDSSD